MSVAVKGEDAGRLWRADFGLVADHGREADVDEFVKIDRDGVEGNQIVHFEVARQFEYEFRVCVQGLEDAEFPKIQLRRGRLKVADGIYTEIEVLMMTLPAEALLGMLA